MQDKAPLPGNMRNPADGWTLTERQEWIDLHPRLGQAGPLFKTTAPDDEWREAFARITQDRIRFIDSFEQMVRDRQQTVASRPKPGQGFAELTKAAQARLDGILAFGGWAVCHQALDEDIATIITRGFLTPGADARKIPGQRNRCHDNAAKLWLADPARCALLRGYALNPDGMWRSHSWVACATNGRPPHLIETTEENVAYFGFMLTADEAAAKLQDTYEKPSAGSKITGLKAALEKALASED
jgi:hypothetical protein